MAVWAAAGDPASSSQWERYAITETDGTFAVDGLGPCPCDLTAGSEPVGFATRSSVTPGEPALLRLTPGGLAQVSVRDETGQPVAGATGIVTTVSGVRVAGLGVAASDGQGTLMLASPGGTVSGRVMKGLRWTDVLVDVPRAGVGTGEAVLALR